MNDGQQIATWLTEELEKHNLSQSEASRRAGLGTNAISEILNGRTPGLKVCKALARQFGYSPLYVLQLAGHLPTSPSAAGDVEIDYYVRAIQQLFRELKALDPAAARALMDTTRVQTEAVLAALRSQERDRRVQVETEPVSTPGG